eukprot:SAG22_NODE_1899_length_3345_cov_1.439310_1_plen_572_part_00
MPGRPFDYSIVGGEDSGASAAGNDDSIASAASSGAWGAQNAGGGAGTFPIDDLKVRREFFVELAKRVCSTHPFQRSDEDIDQLAALSVQLNVEFGGPHGGKLALPDYVKRDAWQFMTVRKIEPSKKPTGPVLRAGQKHGTMLVVLTGSVEIAPDKKEDKMAGPPYVLRFGKSFGAETLADDDERSKFTAVAMPPPSSGANNASGGGGGGAAGRGGGTARSNASRGGGIAINHDRMQHTNGAASPSPDDVVDTAGDNNGLPPPPPPPPAVLLLQLKKKHYDRIVREHSRAEAHGRVDMLGALPLLGGAWATEDLELLARTSSLQYNRAGALLLEQGQPGGDSVYMVRAGQVSIIKEVVLPSSNAADGSGSGGGGRRVRVEVARVGPGGHFSGCYQEVTPLDGGGGGGNAGGEQRFDGTAASSTSSWSTRIVAAGGVAPFSVRASRTQDVETLRVPVAKFLFVSRKALHLPCVSTVFLCLRQCLSMRPCTTQFMHRDVDDETARARMRLFGQTAPTLPADERVVQCVQAQVQWKHYQSQLVGAILNGDDPAKQAKVRIKALSAFLLCFHCLSS